jgi:tRNA/rRNA methyltransferase
MDACRVVLVRPHYAGNLGAAARVMHNFGLSRLVLVDPIADRASVEARRLATHGEFILDQAAIVPDLQTAVADCVLAAATSAKVAGVIRQTVSGAVRELMPRVAESMSRGPVALVFGPEPSGLTNEEIGLCHFLLNIPSDERYPALNLAQAIAICLYELRLSWLTHREAGSSGEPPAPHAELDLMFEHLRQSLEAIHFLYGPKADSLMHAIRHLIGRAAPTSAEAKILHGLARQLEWIAQHSDFRDAKSPGE